MVSTNSQRYRQRDHVSGGGMGGEGPPPALWVRGTGGASSGGCCQENLVGTVVQVAMGGKQHLCPISWLSQDVCLAFFGHPMSHSFPWSLATKKWTCQICCHNSRPNSSHCVRSAAHRRAELVRDVCTVLGFGRLGPRKARPGQLPRHVRPGQADSTSGNGERQRTAPQPKPRGRSTGTSELAVQIKCVRTQMGQCDGADGGTESMQNKLIRPEKRKASGQSCADDLAVQLKVINRCESKISVTFAEIAWLRKVRCGKEEELQKQQKKSEVEFAKWELAKMRVNIVDAKAQVRAAGWTAERSFGILDRHRVSGWRQVQGHLLNLGRGHWRKTGRCEQWRERIDTLSRCRSEQHEHALVLSRELNDLRASPTKLNSEPRLRRFSCIAFWFLQRGRCAAFRTGVAKSWDIPRAGGKILMENAKWTLVKMSSQCKHRGFPSLGQACTYFHSLVSARWPSEALQVNEEKFGEVPDVFEFRITAADSESERSQACAGLAGRGLRALQEAKQKRQKQCGGPSSLSEEENSVGASGQAAVGRKILLCPTLSFSWSGSLDDSAREFVLVTPQNFGKLGLWLCLKGFVLLQCPCFATPRQLAPFSRSRFSLPAVFFVYGTYSWVA